MYVGGGVIYFSSYTGGGVTNHFLFEKTGKAKLLFANHKEMYPAPINLVLNEPALNIGFQCWISASNPMTQYRDIRYIVVPAVEVQY